MEKPGVTSVSMKPGREALAPVACVQPSSLAYYYYYYYAKRTGRLPRRSRAM